MGSTSPIPIWTDRSLKLISKHFGESGDLREQFNSMLRGEGELSRELLALVGDTVLRLYVIMKLRSAIPDASKGLLSTLTSINICNNFLGGLVSHLDMDVLISAYLDDTQLCKYQRAILGAHTTWAATRYPKVFADTLEASVGLIFLAEKESLRATNSFLDDCYQGVLVLNNSD